uniref:Uncharacterized protein n=1 Tax=Romanomermis culicivorax TaxID=13658 RepID=A0A915IYA1_ROMCU
LKAFYKKQTISLIHLPKDCYDNLCFETSSCWGSQAPSHMSIFIYTIFSKKLNVNNIKVLTFDINTDSSSKYGSTYYVWENQTSELLNSIQNFCYQWRCTYQTLYEADYRQFSMERIRTRKERILAHVTVEGVTTDSVHFAVIFSRNDYMWIAKFRKSKLFPMALPKTDFIEYKMKCSISTDAQVYVPRDWTKFSWLLDRSSFMECNYKDVVWPYYEKHERTMVPLEPYVQGLRAMMEVSRQTMNTITVIVTMKALGSWYRQCDFIVESQDFDFNINSTDFSSEFFQTLWSHRHLKPVMRLQNENKISEYRIFAPQRKVFDLFFMYFQEDKYSIFIVHAKNFQLWRQDFPFYDRICSADLLGVLIYLPCDPFKLIQAEYDHDRWMSPNETKQSNMHFVRKFDDRKFFNQTMTNLLQCSKGVLRYGTILQNSTFNTQRCLLLGGTEHDPGGEWEVRKSSFEHIHVFFDFDE